MVKFGTEFDPNVSLMPPGERLEKPNPEGVRFNDGLLFRPRGSAYVCRNWCVPERGAEIREVCAYRFNREMGFDYVPMTVLRQQGQEHGTLRRWLPESFQKFIRNPKIPTLAELGQKTVVELWLLESVLMAVDSVCTNYLWSEQHQQVFRIDMCECLPMPEAVAGRRDMVRSGEWVQTRTRRDWSEGWNWPLLWNWPELHMQHIHDEALDRLARIDWRTLKALWVAVGLEESAANEAEKRAKTVLDLRIIDTEAVWGLPNPYDDIPSLSNRRS